MAGRGGFQGGRGGGGGGGRGGGGRGGGDQFADGGKCKVLSNIFELQDDGRDIHLYGLNFVAVSEINERRMRAKPFRSFALRQMLGEGVEKWKFEFDGATLLSPNALDNFVEGKSKELPLPVSREGMSQETVAISVEKTKTVDRSDEDEKDNFYHRIFHMALNYSPWERHQQKYLVHPITSGPHFCQNALNLADIWRGFTLTVMTTHKGAVVIHEVANRVELKLSVADWRANVSDREVDQKCSAGTRFAPIYNSKCSYALLAFKEMDFDGPMCPERPETFREYYHRKFSTPRGSKRRQAINAECLAIVDELPKMVSMLHALDAEGKHAYLIPKLCKFVDLPEEVRRALPVLCGPQPTERANFMVDVSKHLQSKYDAAPVTPAEVLAAWGLTVSAKPIQPTAVVLPMAKVAVGDVGNKTGPGSMVRKMMQDTAATLSKSRVPVVGKDQFAVLLQKGDGQELWGQLSGAFKQAADRWNFELPKPVELTLPVTPKEVEAFMKRMPPGIKLVVICLGRFSDSMYKTAKQVLLSRGVPSQAVNKMTAFKPQLRKQWNMLCDALVVQILAKMDFPVCRPWPPVPRQFSPSGPDGVDLLVVSVDVYHAPRKMVKASGSNQSPHWTSAPSIAGLCGFWFRKMGMKTFGRASWHNPRQEIAMGDESGATTAEDAAGPPGGKTKDQSARLGVVAEFVSSICAMEKTAPKFLVVMRDGIGRGQEKELVSHEIKQLDAQIEIWTGKGTPCELTYMQLTKKIKQSFVRVGNNEGDLEAALRGGASASNAPAGAVISHESLCKDPAKEFFLFSMGTSPSTARSVQYRVAKKGANTTLPMLQELAFSLAHVYPVWPGPVQLPAPAQYASTAAKRAAEIFLGGQDLGGTHRGLLYL